MTKRFLPIKFVRRRDVGMFPTKKKKNSVLGQISSLPPIVFYYCLAVSERLELAVTLFGKVPLRISLNSERSL